MTSASGARELTPLIWLSGIIVSFSNVPKSQRNGLDALSAWSNMYLLIRTGIIATALKRYWQSVGSSQWKSSTAKTPGSGATKTHSEKSTSSKERSSYEMSSSNKLSRLNRSAKQRFRTKSHSNLRTKRASSQSRTNSELKSSSSRPSSRQQRPSSRQLK